MGEISNNSSAAQFEATASSSGGAIVWLRFVMTYEASNEVVWSWSEYSAPYCTFGSNTMGCNQPDISAPNWWSKLPDGNYRIDVTARAADGGSTTVSRQFQINH